MNEMMTLLILSVIDAIILVFGIYLIFAGVKMKKTKELLAEIDKKAAVIDSVVQRNQEQMMSTITNIVNETVIPKKRDFGEEIGAQFVMGLLSNPEQAQASLNNLGALAELMQKYPSPKKKDQNK